jgi:hypothetical protein
VAGVVHALPAVLGSEDDVLDANARAAGQMRGPSIVRDRSCGMASFASASTIGIEPVPPPVGCELRRAVVIPRKT